MSLQQAKNALVSSLFELSNAANDAAAATVNFYKIAGVEGIEASAVSFANLGETMSNAVKAVTDSIPDAPNANGKASKKLDASPEADEKKPKKKRAPKDPNAPKKPLTSYLRFNLSVREEMKKERFENGQPCHPAIELNQIIADRWSKLKDTEKEKLQKAWEADYEDYKKAIEKYNASKTDGVVVEEEEETEEPKVEKKAAPKKKKAKKAPAEPVPDYFPETVEPQEEQPEEPETKVEEPVQAPKKSKKRKDKDSEDKKLKKKKSHE